MCLCTVASELNSSPSPISSKEGEYPFSLTKREIKSYTCRCRLVIAMPELWANIRRKSRLTPLGAVGALTWRSNVRFWSRLRIVHSSGSPPDRLPSHDYAAGIPDALGVGGSVPSFISCVGIGYGDQRTEPVVSLSAARADCGGVLSLPRL